MNRTSTFCGIARRIAPTMSKKGLTNDVEVVIAATAFAESLSITSLVNDSRHTTSSAGRMPHSSAKRGLEVPRRLQNPCNQWPKLSLRTPPHVASPVPQTESSTLYLTHPNAGNSQQGLELLHLLQPWHCREYSSSLTNGPDQCPPRVIEDHVVTHSPKAPNTNCKTLHP